MANEHLKHALSSAGLTIEQFADIVGVDPKTVQRWIAGRTPYARHRAVIARALDRAEHELWPNDVAPPPPAAIAPIAEGGESAERAVGEVTGAWGRYTGPDVPDPVAMLARPAQRIDIAYPYSGLVRTRGLLDALRERALAGSTVRVLTRAPAEFRTIIGETMQLRLSAREEAPALVRADHTIVLIIPLAGGDQPGVLELRRHHPDGLFDRLLTHFEARWTEAGPTESGLSIADASARRSATDGGAASDRSGASPPPSEPPRRWPGRPN